MLNPHVDIPRKGDCEKIFNRIVRQNPWLKIEHRGTGTHTGRGTSWAGAYDIYELIDPLSPDFGMSGRVAEVAEQINSEMALETSSNLRADEFWKG